MLAKKGRDNLLLCWPQKGRDNLLVYWPVRLVPDFQAFQSSSAVVDANVGCGRSFGRHLQVQTCVSSLRALIHELQGLTGPVNFKQCVREKCRKRKKSQDNNFIDIIITSASL